MTRPGTEMPDSADPHDIARDLDAILLRVGRMNYSWSNTESLLIHLLAGLAQVRQDVAVVLFLSLPSTRARVVASASRIRSSTAHLAAGGTGAHITPYPVAGSLPW